MRPNDISTLPNLCPILEFEAARPARGKAGPCPKQDYGFIYGGSFEDLDGHVIEPMWMDLDAALAAMGSQRTVAA